MSDPLPLGTQINVVTSPNSKVPTGERYELVEQRGKLIWAQLDYHCIDCAAAADVGVDEITEFTVESVPVGVLRDLLAHAPVLGADSLTKRLRDLMDRTTL